MKAHEKIETILKGVAEIHGIDWRLLLQKHQPGDKEMYNAKSAVTHLIYMNTSEDMAKEVMKVTHTEMRHRSANYMRNIGTYISLHKELHKDI